MIKGLKQIDCACISTYCAIMQILPITSCIPLHHPNIFHTSHLPITYTHYVMPNIIERKALDLFLLNVINPLCPHFGFVPLSISTLPKPLRLNIERTLDIFVFSEMFTLWEDKETKPPNIVQKLH